MRLLLIGLVLILTGCECVPVKPDFPEVPAALMAPPKNLKEIPTNATSSEIFETVIENYGLYHETTKSVRGWQEWYNQQKEIYNKR